LNPADQKRVDEARVGLHVHNDGDQILGYGAAGLLFREQRDAPALAVMIGEFNW